MQPLMKTPLEHIHNILWLMALENIFTQIVLMAQ